MTPIEGLKVISALSTELDEHINEHYAAFKLVGLNIANRLRDLRKELFPNEGRGYRYDQYNWVHFYNFIEIKVENGDVRIEYWSASAGGYGDKDELKHEITLNVKLLEPGGVDDYIVLARDTLLETAERRRISEEANVAARISALEQEIATLKGRL